MKDIITSNDDSDAADKDKEEELVIYLIFSTLLSSFY